MITLQATHQTTVRSPLTGSRCTLASVLVNRALCGLRVIGIVEISFHIRNQNRSVMLSHHLSLRLQRRYRKQTTTSDTERTPEDGGLLTQWRGLWALSSCNEPVQFVHHDMVRILCIYRPAHYLFHYHCALYVQAPLLSPLH